MKKILLTWLWGCFPLLLFAQIVNNKYEKGKQGFVDASGNWVIRPIYERADWNKGAGFGTVGEDNKLALVDEKGNIFTPFKYSLAIYDRDIELIKVEMKKGNKTMWGYCNRKGEELIPCEYDKIIPYSGKDIGGYESYVISVMKEIRGQEQYGVLDLQGKIIIPCKYESIDFLKHGMTVYADKKYGIYGYDGKIIYEVIYANRIALTQYSEYERLNIGGTPTESNLYFALGGKWGLGDRQGNILVPCHYDEVQVADEHIFLVNKGGRRVKDEQSGLYSKIVGGQWGYYADGQEIILCQYDQASVFSHGVATVQKDGQAFLIKNPLKDPEQILIAQNGSSVTKKRDFNLPVASRYPAPNSDVDKDIPTVSAKDEHKFAFIIANENYPEAPVPYSLNDGRIFKEYCQKTLGLAENHIRMFEDATFGNLITAVEQMKEISKAYEGEAEIILYYAGHGVPDEKRNSAYLLPVDGNSSDVATTGYSLERLYAELSQMELKNITVFLDACFSGAKREDEMLLSGRGVAIKVKEEAPKGNMVVFSAATGDETAHQLEEKGHGLFTYFLLKKLQETKGQVALGELVDYVTKQVKRQSVVINNKKQTPTVIPSAMMVDKWRIMSLK